MHHKAQPVPKPCEAERRALRSAAEAAEQRSYDATGAQRMADVDLDRLAGAAVLEEERDVRCEGAEEREQDADVKAHSVGRNGRVRENLRCPAADRAIGTFHGPLDEPDAAAA